MRLVSGARYANLEHRYQRMAEARETAEKLAAERLSTITRQAAEITRLRDEHPTSPAQEPVRTTGEVELLRQLHLARETIRGLAERLDALQASHVADTRELHDLRQGAAS